MDIKADGGGLRFNEGKNQLDLIPPEWMWGLGVVMSRGAIKYAKNNWMRGMPWSTMVGCALRHLFKFACGERYDKESGCHHLAHAAWNMLALMTYDLRELGTNDLLGTNTAVLESTATVMGPELQAIADAKAAEKKSPTSADATKLVETNSELAKVLEDLRASVVTPERATG
jgi:hypothetical protein